MTKKKKVGFWGKLKNRYKLSIQNEATYEEVFRMKLSRLHVLIVLCMLAVILVSLTTLLIAFTGLKEFIPGFPDGNMRHVITEHALRVDSLEVELKKRDNFLKSIQLVLRGEDEGQVQHQQHFVRGNYDTIQFNITQEETAFRSAIEEKERFNLTVDQPKSESGGFFHFFPPIAGIVTRSFDEKVGHYGTDLVAKASAKVNAVMDGVVIFTDWTIKTGYVIQLQHANNLVSVYKHNSTLLKKQGDYVRVGETIAVVGNTGEETTGPHLHLELWRAGNPLDPEQFIQFK
ncbi:M23 family metallopeptidase [Odoribacter lunatus]|uniref:M23 family metallopeptidase n=1 Tax=Odoribacter lunatus TaxID=2941335 RepID=UPI00203C4432|nr:M23 family metallopeptidase [Odoribacter lunatus]